MPKQLDDPAEILKKMGLDPEEAIQADQRLSRMRRKSPHICVCGHPVSSHTVDESSNPPSVFCKPSKMNCHCNQVLPVLYAEDNRLFWRKTNSYGNEHALIRGITASMSAGKKVSWLLAEHVICYDCERKSKGDLLPALIELNVYGYPNGKLIKDYKMTKFKKSDDDYVQEYMDVLLCRKCLDKRVLGA